MGIATNLFAAWQAGTPAEDVATDHPACLEALENTHRRISQLLNSEGTTPVDSFHHELGSVMIDSCGISCHAYGLRQGLERVKALEQRLRSRCGCPVTPAAPMSIWRKPCGSKTSSGWPS